jgi:hypothetical protein
MTITHPPQEANQINPADPSLSIDQLIEKHPFLHGRDNQPRRRIYRLRDLGHFPNTTAVPGDCCSGDNQRSKHGWRTA